MSNPTATMTRDIDELEGTLLPVATQVVECCNNTNNNISLAEAAVPVTEIFDYDVAIAEEERLKEQEENEIEAITIPDNGTQHNYAGVSDDSRTAVGNAERVGRFKSEEELDAIRKAKQRIFPHNYHEENSIKKANETAMRRDREGLQIKDDHLDSGVSSLSKTNDKSDKEIMRNQQQKQKPRASGYQVKEYDVDSYDTKGYDVTEYKSVYD